MPFGDWQFYVVTLAALWGAWALVRTFLPSRDDKPAEKRATLTVGGKKVS